MGTINITKKSNDVFTVEVTKNNTRTVHEVILDNDYWDLLCKKHISKVELIKKSFEFLLQRESNTSILSRFDLQIISHYFPEYEREIKKNI